MFILAFIYRGCIGSAFEPHGVMNHLHWSFPLAESSSGSPHGQTIYIELIVAKTVVLWPWGEPSSEGSNRTNRTNRTNRIIIIRGSNRTTLSLPRIPRHPAIKIYILHLANFNTHLPHPQGMDVFSNILFVKEQFAALSQLAHRAVAADKYSPEACCITGNYFSLKVRRLLMTPEPPDPPCRH